MKSTNKRVTTAFLVLFLITAMSVALVSGIYAGYSTTDSATVTAVYVSNGEVYIELAGDNTGVIVPGAAINLANAPEVTLAKDCSPCYVFIKIDKSAGFDDYLYFSLSDGWYKVDGQTDVYFRIQETKVDADAGVTFNVFRDNVIYVDENIENPNTTLASHSLTVTAYAVLKSGSSNAAAAWAELGIN